MAIATVFGNSILDAILNGTNLTADTSIWLSLHTADPGITGTNEVTDATYTRVDVSGSFPAASSKSCSNDVAIEFAAATTGFTATHYGLNSASGTSGGTWYIFGDINPDKVVGAGEILRFAIGQLTVTVA